MKTTAFGATLLGLTALALGAVPAKADTINFETGYTDGQFANIFHTGSNTLTVDATSGRDLFVAQSGNPTTAFHPHDTAGNGDDVGDFFLTDGIKGKNKRTNFEFDFDSAVDQFSLNVIDLGIKGRTASLKACKDANCNEVEKVVSWTVPENDFKGLVSFLDLGSFGAVTHFELDFFSKNGKRTPIDPGIALDNFSFHTAGHHCQCGGGGGTEVPEPATLGLLGTALAGFGYKRRARKS